MVLRKALPDGSSVPAPSSSTVNNPPYPLTPAEEAPPSLPSNQQQSYPSNLTGASPTISKPTEGPQRSKEDLDDESDYSDNEWDQSDEDTSPEDIPSPLRVGGGKPIPGAGDSHALPSSLRVGPPSGVPLRKSLENISPDHTGATSSSFGAASNASGSSVPLQTNNPYLKMQSTGQSSFGNETSQQIWGDVPNTAQKYGEPVELPSNQTPTAPTHEMAALKLDSRVPPVSSAKSPDQPPLIAVESATPQSAQPRHESNASEAYEPGMDLSSIDAFARSYGLPEEPSEENTAQRTWQEQQAWEHSERERKQQQLATAHANAARADQERRHEEEFYKLESAPVHPPAPSKPPPDVPAPDLPPRRSQEEQPPAMPLRPLNTSASATSPVGPESPNTVMTRQRKEHYQIKHIRWHDIKKQGIRHSPILTQNLNGPCPLLALVNALVLSTPAGVETSLIETLRTREQISLGLLLDAVFDELMSGRRGDAAHELPDVSELYRFLLALHTGLNVNPMFVRDPDATDGTSAAIPSLARRPGGFENTRDMKLYRTFDIPLMHGWLPEIGSEAYRAFDRIAKTYETSQYVQFQEEELDAKLQTGSALTTEEQQMFTDIHAIKEFLTTWPTQVSNYGLKAMRENLVPGQIAILFRNDHFSTLYKDPRTDNLVTLVTDQGYSSHDEVVWESLVDVNGQGSELFSGDFRPVGNTSASETQSSQQATQNLINIDDNEGWTTVPSRRGQQTAPASTANQSQTNNTATPESGLTRTEQEDHDLALALQLQEEEEDRHRRSQDEQRRRRENQLSENAIAANTSPHNNNNRRRSAPHETRPVVPPRRNNAPTTHRPNNEAAPPPTYEEAAVNPPYHPPQGHPASFTAPVRPAGSAYQASSQNQPQLPPGRLNHRPSQMQGQMPGRYGRRHSSGPPVGQYEEQDRDKCIVM